MHLKPLLLALLVISFTGTSHAQSDLPGAIECYRDATNAKDIDRYMACFTPNAVMIDVGRTINDADAIRSWAAREVIPHGERFAHRAILERTAGYAKTEVKWLSWVVHYFYWWDEQERITKMSLQYAN